MAWLSITELDKAVVHVIRLASFLWVWFQCIYPLMPSCNTCCLTWVSLTLDVGYLFMAAPAKCSRCSLPWTRGISSGPPLLTLNKSSSSRPFCAHAATTPWSGVAPLHRRPDLGRGVAPPGRHHWPQGFPYSSVGKEFACNARDWDSIPGSGKSPGEGDGIHSSILAWKIPWTEEPGGLQSMGLKSQTWLSVWTTTKNVYYTC